MIRELRERDRVEQRVLGALRCMDATTLAPLTLPVAVAGAGASFIRNRSGLYVIREWTALAAHAIAFEAPPAVPAVGEAPPLDLTLTESSGHYLPRRVRLALPRDSDPANAAAAGSLFRAIDVAMYPSPAAPVATNWTVLRVTATETASGDALGGALLRVTANGTVLARGLTDSRGEALVPVPGVPVTTWSDDPDAVIVSEISATLEAIFDPAAGRRTPAATVRAGGPPVEPPLVDPDAIESARAGLPQTTRQLMLAAGRSLALALPIALP